ncbi:OprD family outer membrane porin [Spartinivicinus ruber]|uniref:OprD family outer membrane porin n=1 Tax=Spartinivicinus ruber TaxID=2683272 RepID=UPI0013CFA09E|nr:OprD family outer membrane porin [Spartinivicinus ruber]
MHSSVVAVRNLSIFTAIALSLGLMSSACVGMEKSNGPVTMRYNNLFVNSNAAQRSEVFDLDEWVHGLELEFKSDYYFGFIGFDFTMGSASYVNGNNNSNSNGANNRGGGHGLVAQQQAVEGAEAAGFIEQPIASDSEFVFSSFSYEQLEAKSKEMQGCMLDPDNQAPQACQIEVPILETEEIDYLRQPQLSSDSSGSLSTISQAYTKLRFGDDTFNIGLHYGLQSVDIATFSTANSNVTASSIFGALITANWKNAQVYLTRFNKYHNRRSSQLLSNLESYDRQSKIKHIDILGLNYQLAPGLTGQLEYGKAGDQLAKYFAKLFYITELNSDVAILFDARYGQAQGKNGFGYYDWLSFNNAQMFTYVRYEDYKSRYINLTSALHTRHGKLYLGYNKTYDADWAGGYFYDDEGTFNSTLALHKNFNHKNEGAWVLGFDYDFAEASLPGLTLSMHYARGSRPDEMLLIEQDEKNVATELGGYLSYTIQTGLLEGLGLGWYYANHKGLENSERVNRLLVTYDLLEF